MESQFVTLYRSDKNFEAYLNGTFSREHRALPVESLNVNTLNERVTFKIVPVEQIQGPSLFKLLWQCFRPEWMSLSLSPIVVTAFYLLSQGVYIYPLSAVSALFAVLFFHAAVFLFNDFFDHEKGVDRINPSSGSQVIQRGWLTAGQVKSLAIGLASLGAGFGLYAMFTQPWILLLSAAGAIVGVVGYSYFGKGFKYIGLGEVIIFVCLGPLLTFGFSRAAAHYASWQILGIGVLMGQMAAVCLQLRQLENIVYDNQAGVKTLVVRMGFDLAKASIQWQLGLSWLMLAVWLGFTAESWVTFLILGPYAVGIFALASRLAQSNSPLSSSLNYIHVKAGRVHLLLALLLVMAFFVS